MDCDQLLTTANIKEFRDFRKWLLTNHPDKVRGKAKKEGKPNEEIKLLEDLANERTKEINMCVDQKCKKTEINPRGICDIKLSEKLFSHETRTQEKTPKPQQKDRGLLLENTPIITVPDIINLQGRQFIKIKSFSPHTFVFQDFTDGKFYLMRIYKRQYFPETTIKALLKIQGFKFLYILEILDLVPIGEYLIIISSWIEGLQPLNIFLSNYPNINLELTKIVEWALTITVHTFHQMNFVLRRISFSDIYVKYDLITGGFIVKLGYFNYLYPLTSENISNCYNYPGYDISTPPEVFYNNIPLSSKECFKLDVWCICVIFFYIYQKGKNIMKLQGDLFSRINQLREWRKNVEKIIEKNKNLKYVKIISKGIVFNSFKRINIREIGKTLLEPDSGICIIDNIAYTEKEKFIINQIFKDIISSKNIKNCDELTLHLNNDRKRSIESTAKFLGNTLTKINNDLIIIIKLLKKLNFISKDEYMSLIFNPMNTGNINEIILKIIGRNLYGK